MPKFALKASRILSVLPIFALGCGKDRGEETGSPIPAGLARIADCEIDPPGASELGEHPETFDQISGEVESLKWACGKGWVNADIGVVWAGLREPQVMVNNRDVAEYTVEVHADPEFDYGWTLHNVVHDVVTVEFDVEWKQGAIACADEACASPTEVSARFEKIEGTPFIELMRGHVWLSAEGDDTLVELYQEMKAAQDPSEQIVQFEQDMFAELVAWGHGEPLPEFD